MVHQGEALEVGAHRRLAEHEADPRARRRSGHAPAASSRSATQAGRAGEPEDRRRGPLPQAPQVLAEACLDRARASRRRGAG